MEPDERLFYKIDDYLRGRQSPGDRAAFESELAADPELAALVRQQEQESQALEVLAERDLRIRMNAWERQMPATWTTPVRARRIPMDYLRWAVAAMLVLAAGLWLLQPREQPDEAPIVMQPETPAAKPPVTTTKPNTTPKPRPAPGRPERRPATQPTKDVIADAPRTTPTTAPAKRPTDYAALADEFYRERDFLPNQLSGGSAATKALVVKELLAHSLLKSRKYDAAIPAFQEIANSGKQPYADRAQWALALAYLHQMPQRSSALNQVLRNITARPGHLYYARAKALQARLGR